MSVQSYVAKINPRWRDAPYERVLIFHEPAPNADGGFIPDCNRFKEPWPLRYDNPQDFYDRKPSIPPFLKVFPDGREEESW